MADDDLTKELALHAGKGLIDKLMGLATGFLSIKTIKKRGEARKADKLIDVDIENEAALKALDGKLAVEKKKIDHEFAVQAYREHVKNNYSAEPRIPTVWALGDYDIEIAEIQPSLLKPLEQRRAFNILSVISEAAKELPEHQPISDETIHPDVATRIFENAKDVSDEYMQKLWGKLLAGEVAAPGRFSLRTLDAVRNLTSDEAQLFHRYLSFCSNHGEIFVPSDVAGQLRLNNRELASLVEGGLMHAAKEGLFGFEAFTKKLPFRQDLILVEWPEPPAFANSKTTWPVDTYQLTRVGIELANLGLPPANEEFVKAICESAKKRGYSVKIEKNQPPPGWSEQNAQAPKG